jgi:hypothetical protein
MHELSHPRKNDIASCAPLGANPNYARELAGVAQAVDRA